MDGALETPQERTDEMSLRPKRLNEYIGQAQARDELAVFIAAARGRGEVLDHTIIAGPPGLGKTTLAYIIASEFGASLTLSSGPALSRTAELATILTSLQPKSVLFIDEIHRLNPAVEEMLYSAMEDRRLDITLGEGASARAISLPLPPFTLVGATTRTGLIAKPLMDRFGIHLHLDFYAVEDLTQIVLRTAELKASPIDAEGAKEIASRARGTPRIANRLFMRVRDFAAVAKHSSISADIARVAIDRMQVDPFGLDRRDRSLLSLIVDRFNGGPVGVGSLAAAMQEERDTIEGVIEPYLIRQGYLVRTSRGRMATPLTRKILGRSDGLFED